MNYMKQFTIIFAISFIGELLNTLIDLPIPASVYGLIILLLLLITKVIKVEDIKDTSTFLINNMSIMFVGPAISIIAVWPLFKQNILAYSLVIMVSTTIVMIVSGKITQVLTKKWEPKNERNNYIKYIFWYQLNIYSL